MPEDRRFIFRGLGQALASILRYGSNKEPNAQKVWYSMSEMLANYEAVTMQNKVRKLPALARNTTSDSPSRRAGRSSSLLLRAMLRSRQPVRQVDQGRSADKDRKEWSSNMWSEEGRSPTKNHDDECCWGQPSMPAHAWQWSEGWNSWRSNGRSWDGRADGR